MKPKLKTDKNNRNTDLALVPTLCARTTRTRRCNAPARGSLSGRCILEPSLPERCKRLLPVLLNTHAKRLQL